MHTYLFELGRWSDLQSDFGSVELSDDLLSYIEVTIKLSQACVIFQIKISEYKPFLLDTFFYT